MLQADQQGSNAMQRQNSQNSPSSACHEETQMLTPAMFASLAVSPSYHVVCRRRCNVKPCGVRQWLPLLTQRVARKVDKQLPWLP